MYINIKNFLLFCFYLIINTNALANYFMINEFELVEMQDNKEIKYQKDNGEIPVPYIRNADKYWVDYDNKRIFKRFALGTDIGEGPWIIVGYDLKGNQLPFVVPNGYNLKLTKNSEIDIITATFTKGISNRDDHPLPGETLGFRNYNAKTLVLNKIKKIDTLLKDDILSIHDNYRTIPNIFCKISEKYYGSYSNYELTPIEYDGTYLEPVYDNNLKIINKQFNLHQSFKEKLCTDHGAYLIGSSIYYLDLSNNFGEITDIGQFGNLERCQLQKNFEIMFCFEKKNETLGLYKIDLKNKSKSLLWNIPKNVDVIRMSLSRTGKKIMLGLVSNLHSYRAALSRFNKIAIINRDNPKNKFIHTFDYSYAIGFYSEE